MKFVLCSAIFFCALLCSLLPTIAFASCSNGVDEMTILGTGITRLTYPQDSSSTKPLQEGLIKYSVIVASSPVCYRAHGEYLKSIFTLQLTGPAVLPDAESMKNGVIMTVKGKIIPRSSSNHFEHLLIEASSITVSN